VSEQRSPSSGDACVSKQGSLQFISDIPWCTCHRPSTWPISCTKPFSLSEAPKDSGGTTTPPVKQSWFN